MLIGESTARIRRWLFETALPVWLSRGLDIEHGGPVESFALHGDTPSGVSFKRTFVCARQIYVLSHAAITGVSQAAAPLAKLYEFFVGRMWRGSNHGWLRTVTTSGVPDDPIPDLYTAAFALFGLGWYHKATNDASAIELAHSTLDVIERDFRHQGGLGYHHVLPASLPRQQNPHMHLMEAALVLAESSRDERFFDLAATISRLFLDHIARFPAGVLPEFFDDNWQPVSGEKGRWVEPGHQYEWAWILAQHHKLAGVDHTNAISALVAWAEKHGVDPATNVVVNGVRDDGVLLDRGSRVWPNTERIKGWLGLFEVSGTDPRAAIVSSTNALFERFLAPAPPGMWFDAIDAERRPTVGTIPSSTLYHLFLAFSEVLRLAHRLGASP